MNLIEIIETLKNREADQGLANHLKFLHAWDFFRKNTGKMSDGENRDVIRTLMIYAGENPACQVMALESAMDFAPEDEAKEIFRTILAKNKEIGKICPEVLKSRTYRMIISRVHEKYGRRLLETGNTRMALRCYQNALESLPNRTAKIREKLESEISLLMLEAA